MNTNYKCTLYTLLFCVGACQSPVTGALDSVPLPSRIQDDNMPEQEKVVLQVEHMESEESPTSNNYQKIFSSLPLELKCAMAATIINAAKWHSELEKFIDYNKNPDSHKASPLTWNYIDEPENYFTVLFVPELKKLSDNKQLHYLLEAEEGICGPRLIFADIFSLVTLHYIEEHPEDKNGWDFLWYFMHEEEEELRFFSRIKQIFIERKLWRYPYGAIIWNKIKGDDASLFDLSKKENLYY